MQSLIGKKIGKYEVLAKLGEGGMGVVYKARDTALERAVALKMMTPGLAQNERFLKRFLAEARALAMLEDPNIVTVYDMVESDQGLFIVLQYVDGLTLADLVRKKGVLSPEEAIDIFKQMLTALGHAHAAGIIHRDVKPRNVMVTPQGRTMVMDFGVAKIQQGPELTKSSTTVGTLAYMSPEQVRGNTTIDRRSDIYSAGLTLYEALAGRTPFEKSSAEIDILNAIVHGDIPPPHKHNADVPKALSQIVMKSIACDPAKRFQSAEEMIEAFDRFEQKTLARRAKPQKKKPSTAERTQRAGVPNWVVPLVLVVGAVAAGFYYFMGTRTEPESTPPSTPPTGASLSITSEPTGASVEISGETAGTTPLREAPVEAGVVAMVIQKKHYFPVDTSVTLEPGEQGVLAVRLQPSGNVSIQVEPRDARVVLDGRQIGASILRNLRLAVGMHRISVSRDGHEPLDGQFQVAHGDNAPLRYSLAKLKEATQRPEHPVVKPPPEPRTGGLEISSSPGGATLLLNERPMGTTPFRVDDLPAGEYRLLLRLDDHEDYMDLLRVRAGKRTSISASLIRVAGRLNITSQPDGANVLIDGKDAGATPLTGIRVGVGDHKVALRRAGYRNYATTVTVARKRTATVNARLSALVGRLNVRVLPWGSIFVDGNLRKKNTDVQYSTELPLGGHVVRAEHPALGAWERRVDIRADRPQNVRVDFNQKVLVTVTSFDASGSPLWSEIFLDGKPTGKMTPTQLHLRIGLHTVEVRRIGYELSDAPSILNFERDLQEPLRFTLQKSN